MATRRRRLRWCAGSRVAWRRLVTSELVCTKIVRRTWSRGFNRCSGGANDCGNPTTRSNDASLGTPADQITSVILVNPLTSPVLTYPNVAPRKSQSRRSAARKSQPANLALRREPPRRTARRKSQSLKWQPTSVAWEIHVHERAAIEPLLVQRYDGEVGKIERFASNRCAVPGCRETLSARRN